MFLIFVFDATRNYMNIYSPRKLKKGTLQKMEGACVALNLFN